MCVFVFAERRIECYVINGKRSLGHEASLDDDKKKGLKRKKPGRKEAWKRIIAKYISSIRDAFLGWGLLLVRFDGPRGEGWQRRSPENPVGLFHLEKFKALKIQINVSNTTTNRAFVRNNLSLSQCPAYFDTVYGLYCVTHTAWSLLMRKGSVRKRRNRSGKRKISKEMSVNYAIIKRPEANHELLMDLAADLIYFRTSSTVDSFLLQIYFRFGTWCAFD